MIYEVGMLCKHFKGNNLLEKNIYRIEKLGVSGKDIDENLITYSGDGVLKESENLVVYSNIFQENKFFAREYEDISSELSQDKQQLYSQQLKVQPLTQEEIDIVNSSSFKEEKNILVKQKFSK